MKNLHSIALASTLLMGVVFTSACNSGGMRSNPGKTYAPDMTYSRAYDAYTANPNFEDGQTSRIPVKGTVTVDGELPIHWTEADSVAYKGLTTSRKFSEADLEEGKRLYDIYCGVCHGGKLDGQGPLYTSGKFAAMPANLVDAKYTGLTVGQIYYSIKYGKNMMGSYASQLNEKKRWEVIAYIKKMQSEAAGVPFTMGSTTVEVAQTTTTTDSTAATH